MHLMTHLPAAMTEPAVKDAGFGYSLVVSVLSSSGTRFYSVAQLPDGRWICPCKGFEYRQACKHVTRAQVTVSDVQDVAVLDGLLLCHWTARCRVRRYWRTCPATLVPS